LWYEGKPQHKGAAPSPPPSEALWGYGVPAVTLSFLPSSYGSALYELVASAW
jgi:hypothetical protein